MQYRNKIVNAILIKIALILLVSGCDNDQKNGTSSLEEERQKNMSVVNAAPTETSSKPSIPKFILACSTGTGQTWYRIASNGTDIYYASIVNENNLRATKKSYEIVATEREIKIKLRSGDEERTHFMEINRSNLFVSTGYFVSKQMYPPDGFLEMGLNCETIEDDKILSTLINAYDTTFIETQEKKIQYENRPNKI
jgi:hypothetical protein